MFSKLHYIIWHSITAKKFLCIKDSLYKTVFYRTETFIGKIVGIPGNKFYPKLCEGLQTPRGFVKPSMHWRFVKPFCIKAL